jgi:hypothetical protein
MTCVPAAGPDKHEKTNVSDKKHRTRQTIVAQQIFLLDQHFLGALADRVLNVTLHHKS